MPIYEYECKKCEFTFEIQQKHDEESLKKCPKCNTKNLYRIITGGVYTIVCKEPTTLGHLAEKNTKALGKEQVQRLEEKRAEDKIKAKRQAFDELKKAGKIRQDAILPEDRKEDNWYGSLPETQKKNVENGNKEKITKYILEGE